MAIRIVVGLGNPGTEYAATRHNVGYGVVDMLAARHDFPAWSRRQARLQAESSFKGRSVLLVKPITFMNRSGQALIQLGRETSFEPSELLVCYDDLALPLGRIRLRPSGSHGGHNGMRSVLARLQTFEIPRLRIGVAPESGAVDDASEFVLNPFRRGELPVMEAAIERAADGIECALEYGLMTAMNRYNPPPD